MVAGPARGRLAGRVAQVLGSARRRAPSRSPDPRAGSPARPGPVICSGSRPSSARSSSSAGNSPARRSTISCGGPEGGSAAGWRGFDFVLCVVIGGVLSGRPPGRNRRSPYGLRVDPDPAAQAKSVTPDPTQKIGQNPTAPRQPPTSPNRCRPAGRTRATPDARTRERPPPAPLLKPAVRRRRRADPGQVERVPLHPRPQHQQDCVHRSAVRHAGVVTPQRMRRPRRQQRLDPLPQPIRNPPAVIAIDEPHSPPPLAQNQPTDQRIRPGLHNSYRARP